MANRNDVGKLPLIIDCVDHPILADPNPPEISLPSQFAAASGTWCSRQRFDRRHYPLDERRIQSPSSLRAERANVIVYSATEFTLFAQALFDRIECFPWLLRPRAGGETVVEVLPQFAVLVQINQDSDLLALIIDDKLNAFPYWPLESSVPQIPCKTLLDRLFSVWITRP